MELVNHIHESKEKEDRKMKTREAARKMTYLGVGAGLVLFAVTGLLPGSLLGGVIGLSMAGSLFGHPVSSTLMPRLIVGMSMLVGVLVSAVIFIAGSASAGWLAGYMFDSLKAKHAVEAGPNSKY